jgi:hypothetical protein
VEGAATGEVVLRQSVAVAAEQSLDMLEGRDGCVHVAQLMELGEALPACCCSFQKHNKPKDVPAGV